MKKTKIIIYGGSFDPPHKGHFKLLRAAIKEIKPDKVYVVAGWRSPFKNFPFASYRDREKMFRMGAREFKLRGAARLVFHPFEYKRKKTTYTYQIIDYFSLKHPRAQLFFLMGSDCLNSFNKWKKHKLIIKKAVLLVGKREGFLPEIGLSPPVVFLKDVFPEISSTEIKRDLFIEGFSKNVSASVLRHMEQKKLYLSHMRKWLKLNLNPERFKHCKETMRLALDLAAKHGIDAEKAATAALLHDAARDFGEKKLKVWASKNKEKIPFFQSIMKNEPLLFHSHMSADMARNKFFVKDKDILSAIRYHTVGAAQMSVLGKIIYISDMAGKDRDAIFPSAVSKKSNARAYAAAIRKKAFLNIDKAFFFALKCKMEYMIKEKKWMHPRSYIIYQTLFKKTHE